MTTNRREFIKKAGKTGFCVCCGGALSFLESCGASYLVASIESGDKIIIDKSLFIDKETGGKRQFVTVQTQRRKKAIYLSGILSKNYSAVLLRCTHKGCAVRPGGDILICPCHGSEYSPQGEVLKSPAEKNLERFKVSYDQDFVYIHLSS